MSRKIIFNRKLKAPVSLDRGELHNGRLSQFKNHNADESFAPNEYYSKKE
jgi:hypothetical protein